VRSPHAHATLKKPRYIAKAKDHAGRHRDAIPASDVADDKVGGLICGWMIHSKDGTPMKAGPHPVLAQGKVRYVGDHVAVVIADTLARGEGRGGSVDVDYGVLPANVDTAKAPKGGRRSIRKRRTIPVYDWHIGDQAATEAAIAAAKPMSLDQ
jgi:carbon-monoxide dehydrogenase large subunit